MTHTFTFTDNEGYKSFSCNSQMPCSLYDKLRDVVRNYYKPDK